MTEDEKNETKFNGMVISAIAGAIAAGAPPLSQWAIEKLPDGREMRVMPEMQIAAFNALQAAVETIGNVFGFGRDELLRVLQRTDCLLAHPPLVKCQQLWNAAMMQAGAALRSVAQMNLNLQQSAGEPGQQN